MKQRFFRYLALIVLTLSFTLPLASCVAYSHHHHHHHKERPHNRPPGHQKKIYKQRSAKKFAPGHKKKHVPKKHKNKVHRGNYRR